MEAKLEQRCRDLAGASLTAFRAENGGRNPTQEADKVVADRLWNADWHTLRFAGAAPSDQAAYQGCWEICFFSIVGAGRG